MRTESRFWTVVRLIVIVIGASVFLFPFLWMISTSVTSSSQLFQTPPQLIPDPVNLDAYGKLFNTGVPIGRWIANSVFVSLAVCGLQVLTSAMAAYAFTRLRFPGRDAIFVLFLATLMVPFQVLVVPLFIEMRYLGFVNSYAGLILPDIAMPFGVFLLRQAFLGLPRELEEAAFVDGAGHIRVFFRIMLPLAKPVIATVAVFSFMGAWNNFLWPLIIVNNPQLMTLPLGLASFASQHVNDWNLTLAGATISVLPIVAVFLFAQRYVLQGVAMSGLRG